MSRVNGVVGLLVTMALSGCFPLRLPSWPPFMSDITVAQSPWVCPADKIQTSAQCRLVAKLEMDHRLCFVGCYIQVYTYSLRSPMLTVLNEEQQVAREFCVPEDATDEQISVIVEEVVEWLRDSDVSTSRVSEGRVP